jgi:hypothetical protein
MDRYPYSEVKQSGQLSLQCSKTEWTVVLRVKQNRVDRCPYSAVKPSGLVYLQ